VEQGLGQVATCPATDQICYNLLTNCSSYEAITVDDGTVVFLKNFRKKTHLKISNGLSAKRARVSVKNYSISFC
jgi:hypothetical protein